MVSTVVLMCIYLLWGRQYFLTALLKSDWYTKACTYVMCTIWGVWTDADIHDPVTITCNRHIQHLPKQNWQILARITKKKREKPQIKKIRNESEDITIYTREIIGIIGDHYEQLHANTLDNLEERDKFLDTHNLLKVNHEEIENLNTK